MVDNNQNIEAEVITLVDEEGKEHDFDLVDAIEVDEEKYAILAPILEDEEPDEVIILKVAKDENGEDVLYDIEDDDEWEKVANAWQELIEEEENE